jgi:hypothetical protein
VETVVRARVAQIGARRRLPVREVVGVLTAAVGGRDLATVARKAIERHQKAHAVQGLELLLAYPQAALLCLVDELAR